MTPRYTFKEGERLKREVHIETLFRTGKAFSVFPVRFIYRNLARAEGEEYGLRVGVSAAKKKFRRAHERNRVKRLMREAWRLHKHELAVLVAPEEQWHLFLICTATEIPGYADVLAAVQKGIARLKKELGAPVV